jgi:DNA-binding response OmpR family regulator
LPVSRVAEWSPHPLAQNVVADEWEQDMAERNHTAPYRVLVVEHDVECSALIIRTAGESGYAGLAATDPLSIDEAIRNWRPHVVTLDLCLPEIDGRQVISLIKAAGFAGDLIIISGEPEWVRDLTAGMATERGLSVPAHMAKPVDVRQLHEPLKRSTSEACHQQPSSALHKSRGPRTQERVEHP